MRDFPLEMAMSRFARSLLVLFAAFASCAYAQSGDTRPLNHVAVARQFLRELYPGLSRQLYVTIHDHQLLDGSDSLGLFGIELDKPKWIPPVDYRQEALCRLNRTFVAKVVFARTQSLPASSDSTRKAKC
jgi:hypothetical protein